MKNSYVKPITISINYYLKHLFSNNINIVFISLFLMATFSPIHGQDAKLSLKLQNVPLSEVINQIEAKTGYSFLVRSNDVNLKELVSVNAVDKSVEDILTEVFKHKEIKFEITGKSVSVFKPLKEKNSLPASLKPSKKISGTVTDERGDAIIGASVLVKGDKTGTVTDFNGNFNLMVTEDAVLKISYIGYNPTTTKVGDQNNLKVMLVETNKGLEEVVVVGYGTQKKATLTGSIANISGENLLTTKTSNVAAALQGKVSGVQIRQQSGQPGANTTNINIRGFGTPLFVIDDVTATATDFNRLNASDIESMSVLKDASAAIFGMNADNGVVIVRTKRGKAGKLKTEYSSSMGITSPTNVPQMSNAPQYVTAWNNSTRIITGNPYVPQEELTKWQTGAPGYESNNWYDATIKKYATQQLHNISFTGGNDVVSFFTGIGYTYDGGLLKSNALDFQKVTVTNNVSFNISKNLKANFNFLARLATMNQPTANFENIFATTRNNLPTQQPLINNDPRYPGMARNGQNGVAMSDPANGMQQDNERFTRANVDLAYSFDNALKGLQLKFAAFYNNNNTIGTNVWTPYSLYDATLTPTIFKSPAASRVSNSNLARLNLQYQISYNKTIAENHSLGGTLVYEAKRDKGINTVTGRQFDDFFTSDIINQGSTKNMTADGSNSDYASLSTIGRFNYGYAGKYLAEFAFRRDGSYRYAPDKKYGFFPVYSLGWRASEEKFMKNNLSFITNLKFRGSYGTMGRDLGNAFEYLEGFNPSGESAGFYEFVDGTQTNGIAAPAIPNSKLSWMNIQTKDVGFDLSILDGLIDLEFDLYQKDRQGLLANRLTTLPNTFGATMPQENLNSDRTVGIEFALGTKGKIGDFNYQVNGNFNFFRSKDIYVERADFTNSKDQWKNLSAGRWDDRVFQYQGDGQFKNFDEINSAPIQNGGNGNAFELPGDYKYKDVDGNGKIDGNDMLPTAWDATPNMSYGLTVGAQWKGFDFNMLWQGSGLYSDVVGIGPFAQSFNQGTNLPAYWSDSWHPIDPYGDLRDINNWAPGKYPVPRENGGGSAIFAGERQSTFWRKDATFFRLKNIEVGYTLSERFNKRMGISKMRLFVNGFNLITIADEYVKQFDPEVSISGSDTKTSSNSTGIVYPLSRIFNFGLNVTF